MERENIRNFCIIAHIDHGKSTLADRFIQRARMVEERDWHDQVLDNLDIERERGITIKSQAVTLPFEAADGRQYELNLVDTPGHVDFSYEVSRAIASSEGALLLIDATQGVEAQTLSNMYMAVDHDLEIIPVINKIDLPAANLKMCYEQIEEDLGLEAENAVHVSAKQGTGVEELLEAIVERVPPPRGDLLAPLKANIFDSNYDPYRGVLVHIRVFDGRLRVGDRIRVWSNGATYDVEEVGRFRILLDRADELVAGDVGYLMAGIKNISDIRVGDTITNNSRPTDAPLPGFRPIKPVVFSSIFPLESDDYYELSRAMEKLTLNDASLVYEKDSSGALGFGFKCGFLGLLHMEVVQERLEREFDLSIVVTAPSVAYELDLTDGETILVDSPHDFPDHGSIKSAREPFIRASIMTPTEHLGNVIALCEEKRGTQTTMHYLDRKRVEVVYDMPLAEILYEFYDRLKSVSRGYASFDYELTDYRETEVVKLDILVNGRPVDALSQIVFAGHADARARVICRKLKEEIPRHQFKIPVQGAVGSRIVARETVNALRKDVTAKCYGGDVTRKRKLLEKQREGKRRMRQVGNVELPQSAFLSVLKGGEE